MPGAAPAPTPVVKPVPFNEAVAAFDRRAPNLVPSDRWDEMWQEDHATAFTVARSAGYDILGDIRDEFQKQVLQGGETYESFAKNLKPVLQQKGWWGKSEEPDGSTVQLGSMSRLRTIYDTNLRVSYAAGQWERTQRTKRALPFLVYEGIHDSRQRPAHRAWTGTCLPVDDPWWNTHYPPCGWNCRCWARQVTRMGAAEIGITEKAPTGPTRKFLNKSTGETVEVPYGIDPGFGYNVGKASLEGRTVPNAAKVMADKLAGTPPRVAAVPLPGAILNAQTQEFASWIGGMNLAQPKGDQRVVGALGNPVLDFLALPEIAATPSTGAITVNDHAVGHMMRDAKGTKRPAIDDIKRLPALLAHPDAVLWDNEKSSLIYVVATTGASGTRLVVELDRSVKVRDAEGKRQKAQTNAIISGQVMNVDALRDRARFRLVQGKLS